MESLPGLFWRKQKHEVGELLIMILYVMIIISGHPETSYLVALLIQGDATWFWVLVGNVKVYEMEVMCKNASKQVRMGIKHHVVKARCCRATAGRVLRKNKPNLHRAAPLINHFLAAVAAVAAAAGR